MHLTGVFGSALNTTSLWTTYLAGLESTLV